MIYVYHDPEIDFREHPERVYVMTEKELVAVIDTNDLEVTYRLTNSIEDAWFRTKDPRVRVVQESRSTSVGDFMSRDGVWYMIGMVGFKRLTGGTDEA